MPGIKRRITPALAPAAAEWYTAERQKGGEKMKQIELSPTEPAPATPAPAAGGPSCGTTAMKKELSGGAAETTNNRMELNRCDRRAPGAQGALRRHRVQRLQVFLRRGEQGLGLRLEKARMEEIRRQTRLKPGPLGGRCSRRWPGTRSRSCGCAATTATRKTSACDRLAVAQSEAHKKKKLTHRKRSLGGYRRLLFSFVILPFT